ncbi:adenine deaminase [Clostridium sp.]|uniref:adenine deaminase n=1 Tax=Clostridium sp. TaxID=1506 RepID=UPI003D6D85F3
MENKQLKKLIEVASGRQVADLVIKNCKVIDVYNSTIINGDIAICDDEIAGIGEYSGQNEIDAKGQYASPGFIDSHIHIESSYVSPEELGKLLVPHGATTIIADPHEIVNVCGIDGLDYMLAAAKGTSLDIKFMLPSCVPATPFEHSGATIDAKAMEEPIKNDKIIGLGEFMNYPGVINADSDVLDKLILAKNSGKLIDGHSPFLEGKALNAYAAAQIHTDHECSTIKEMTDRLSRGIYVLLREGSACHDLEKLIKGVTVENSRRCLLCSDDRQPKTILELGHLDHHLRICVREGINPITAIQMASLNAAECFRLTDRGAIAPGLRADIVLFDNLQDFNISKVFIEGREVASKGRYLLPLKKYSIDSVKVQFSVRDFSKDKLKLKLKSNKVYVIDILPGGVLTGKGIADVNTNLSGEFVYNENAPIAKVAVVERHQNTGNVAVALLRNYGITSGAIALSIAHDSHNIITVGVNDEDMELAINTLIEQGGGIVLAKNNKVLEAMPMPIGGIMSDQSGEWVNNQLIKIHNTAHNELGISSNVEPVMTLCFMSLAVIPEIKITDMGLFDVTAYKFINVEVGL